MNQAREQATAQSSSHIHAIYYNYEYLLQRKVKGAYMLCGARNMALCLRTEPTSEQSEWVSECVSVLSFPYGNDVEWYILFDCYITHSLVSPHSHLLPTKFEWRILYLSCLIFYFRLSLFFSACLCTFFFLCVRISSSFHSFFVWNYSLLLVCSFVHFAFVWPVNWDVSHIFTTKPSPYNRWRNKWKFIRKKTKATEILTIVHTVN